jgi:hypothetical protein
MESLQRLFSQKIFSLTEKIQKDFPSIYEHLDETPFSLKFYNKHEIDNVDLMAYLEQLISQINYYKKTTYNQDKHPTKKSNKNNNNTITQNENWSYQKQKLLEIYPILKETDLLYIDGKKEEMIERVCEILKITKKELHLLLKII